MVLKKLITFLEKNCKWTKKCINQILKKKKKKSLQGTDGIKWPRLFVQCRMLARVRSRSYQVIFKQPPGGTVNSMEWVGNSSWVKVNCIKSPSSAFLSIWTLLQRYPLAILSKISRIVQNPVWSNVFKNKQLLKIVLFSKKWQTPKVIKNIYDQSITYWKSSESPMFFSGNQNQKQK